MSGIPNRPPRLEIAVARGTVVLVRVDGERYVAEVAGARRPMRVRRRRSYGGGWDVDEGSDPAAPANLDPLLRVLELERERTTALPRGVRFEATDNWGHFRQNDLYTVTIEYAADGAVEIDMAVATQDESYY
jgi:hypothetical protein